MSVERYKRLRRSVTLLVRAARDLERSLASMGPGAQRRRKAGFESQRAETRAEAAEVLGLTDPGAGPEV